MTSEQDKLSQNKSKWSQTEKIWFAQVFHTPDVVFFQKKEKQIVLVKRWIGMLKNKFIILSKSADLFSSRKLDVAWKWPLNKINCPYYLPEFPPPPPPMWACLWWLMAYQLAAKDVGRIMSWMKASWAWLSFKVVWNVVLMAHITGMRSSCWAEMVARSWVMRQLKCRRFPMTWWVCLRILWAWAFLMVVNLDLIPYDWRSSWNSVEMNSVPLSCKQAINRAGVATEPNLVKGASNGDASLVFQCHDFHKLCV